MTSVLNSGKMNLSPNFQKSVNIGIYHDIAGYILNSGKMNLSPNFQKSVNIGIYHDIAGYIGLNDITFRC
jgi:hypothetical protein